MELRDILTPALVIDRARLRRNADRLVSKMRGAGVLLRPHLKTTKSMDVYRSAFGGASLGITVSTLREAEYFLEQGLPDIIYSVGIVLGKLDAVARLMARGADLKVLVDDPEAALAVASHVSGSDSAIKVLIEVDCDGHRSGIKPGDSGITVIGGILHEGEGSNLVGVLTHAGAAYDCTSVEQIRIMAGQERAAVITAANQLREAGLPCPIVSVGSTPTATFGENFDGITEVRAGVFLFQDLYQVGLGVCTVDDLALSVLASVVGYNKDMNRLITDAGMIALSLDRSTASQKSDMGYGAVCDLTTATPFPGMIVESVNQEHGIITSREGAIDYAKFPIGSRVRILPNHACTTAAAHDHYHVVEGGHEIVDTWDRIHGW